MPHKPQDAPYRGLAYVARVDMVRDSVRQLNQTIGNHIRDFFGCQLFPVREDCIIADKTFLAAIIGQLVLLKHVLSQESWVEHVLSLADRNNGASILPLNLVCLKSLAHRRLPRDGLKSNSRYYQPGPGGICQIGTHRDNSTGQPSESIGPQIRRHRSLQEQETDMGTRGIANGRKLEVWVRTNKRL